MSENVVGFTKNSNLHGSHILDIFFRDRMRSAALQASALNHEFYTPLAIIKSIAEKILKGPDQNLQNQLQEIINETSRLLITLERLSLFSTLEDSKSHRVSLLQVVQQEISYFENIFLKNGISVQLDIDEKLLVETEPFRFRCILGVLLQNAIESFKSLNSEIGKRLTVHTQNNENFVVLIVSDNGKGISDEMQKKIRSKIFADIENFEMDIGIGLAMAYHLAKTLRIEFDFVSEVDLGTSFTLTFKK